MSRPPIEPGTHAAFVFDRLLSGRADTLEPEERRRAEAFWDQLAEFDEPELAEEAPARRPAAAFAGAGIGLRAAVAAGLALLLLAAAALWLRPPTAAVDGISYAAGHSERRSVRLADGSTVSLGGESEVVVHFDGPERRIRLTRGQALFEVAPDARRPFIVELDHGEVRAVGTAFDVRLNRDDARVTVVEGVVSISLNLGAEADRGRPISRTARAGEQVRFGIGREPGAQIAFIGEAEPVDPAKATAWTRGILHFRGEPLEEVIAVVNRYAPQRIVLTDRSLARIPVYAVLHEGDTAALIDLIEDPDGLTIEPRLR